MPLTMGFFKPAAIPNQVTIAVTDYAEALSFSANKLTFTNVDFGSNEIGRYLYFAVNSQGNQAVNTVVVNGVTTTRVARIRNTNPSPDMEGGIYYTDAISSSTGTVEINFAGTTGVIASISAFKVMGVDFPVNDFDSDQGNETTSTTTIDVPAFGGYIALHQRNDPDQSVTWTNATEIQDIDVFDTSYRHSTATGTTMSALTGRIITGASSSGNCLQVAVAIG